MRSPTVPYCLLVILLLFANGYSTPDWPNEPAGSTVLVDCAMNNTNCDGQFFMLSGIGQLDVTQPAGAPMSSPNALATHLAKNSAYGNGSAIWPNATNAKALSEIYVGFWWKMNADFQGYANSTNKLFFIATQDFPFGQAQMNGCFLITGPPDQFPWQMYFSHNSGNLDNSHACANDLGLTCFPNVSSVPLYRNMWYRVEAYVKSSTCTTCRNGIVRWWINGTLVGNYTNMNYGSGVVNEFQINNTWDGQPAASCYNATSNPYGRDCSREWFHYFDHLRISETHGAPAPFYIQTSSFSSARVRAPFTATLQATGGTTPYQWLLESGSLPPGLSLNQNTGVISGSPTCAGRSNFTIRIIDASSPALTSSKSFSIIASGTPACATNIEASNEVTPEMQFGAVTGRGQVNFRLPQAKAGARQLTIFDFAGKRICEHMTMDPNITTIKIVLKNGVYLAKLRSGLEANTCRFHVVN